MPDTSIDECSTRWTSSRAWWTASTANVHTHIHTEGERERERMGSSRSCVCVCGLCVSAGIPCITDCVIGELEKMGHRYRLALRLAKVHMPSDRQIDTQTPNHP